jgi:hypothetical protein
LCNQTAYRLTYALTIVLSHLSGAQCNEAAKSHAVCDRIYTAADVRDIPHTANVSHLLAEVRSTVELFMLLLKWIMADVDQEVPVSCYLKKLPLFISIDSCS